ncbi:MAG TPA: class I SAM-dependent DNA methyltransferase [Mariniphaga anaerophila]|uniref:site-specific DNA-methyltransferase (adenine-specific) n=1 Tax=Mariniphaga anaerophila TaxID=1484053 RepID=A0A831LQ26_9BACT|nr:class I SAM-dependent DNA methyltransferase [Mariniphaga anaerophila]
MNPTQIEENLQQLVKSYSKQKFIYDFLLAYGLPKATISRLKNGNLNLSKVDGEVSLKRKIIYKPTDSENLLPVLESLAETRKHDQRFVLVTDFNDIIAIDTKTQEKLDVHFTELPRHFDFFLPLAGIEKTKHRDENEADVKAAEKMAKLFDTIKKDNPDNSPEFIHSLNVFLSRLLFCFFAEDTGIFKKNQFTNALASHSIMSGGDLKYWFNDFFNVLNTPKNKRRESISAYLNDFPYVNGGLFWQQFKAPRFSRRSRQAIIDGGNLGWADINPDIFGSMFQAVIGADQRGNLGQHYTSVPNIMKVIRPLFLDELYETFEKYKHEPRKLQELLFRLSHIKIFDPACGSGNFLIIAYKELRILEMKIIRRLLELQKIANSFRGKEEQLELIPKSQLSFAASYNVELFSHISLNQFYGIEIDDFAHEVTTLALWLAEHQMNLEFYKEFGHTNPTLPLTESGNIVQGNACRLNWEEVCPKNEGDEIYVLGNPPYLGYSLQSTIQKEDMRIAFDSKILYKNLDYISCWFWLSSKYIKGYNIKSSFVSTNSIVQGEQVAGLWSPILKNQVEIGFAFQAFKWTNNAKKAAGVTCVIIGLQNNLNNEKFIYTTTIKKKVSNITPYLIEGKTRFIKPRTYPLAKLPKLLRGSGPVDGGFLIFSIREKDKIISDYPESKKYFKKLVGASELINKIDRWCLWISDKELNAALSFPPIHDAIEKVKQFRLKSKKKATRNAANFPHRFGEDRHIETNFVLIPSHSSENRKYIPIGFINKGAITTNSAQAIYDAEPWIFAVITSTMHMVWIKNICGSLETRIRYSAKLGYNTFPFPLISDQRQKEIIQCAFRILEERAKHSEKTLAQLYDPDKMPEGLREAHRLNDLAIERCYRSKPFESDEERLEYLFKLYERMIAEEKENLKK